MSHVGSLIFKYSHLKKFLIIFFSGKSFTSRIQIPPIWSVSYFPSVSLRKEPCVVVLVLSNKVKTHFSFQLLSHFVYTPVIIFFLVNLLHPILMLPSLSYFPSVWLRKEPVFGASVVVLVLYNEGTTKKRVLWFLSFPTKGTTKSRSIFLFSFRRILLERTRN